MSGSAADNEIPRTICCCGRSCAAGGGAAHPLGAARGLLPRKASIPRWSRAQLELEGARYTRAVDKFMIEVIRHRALANMFLNGEKSRHDAVLAIEDAAQQGGDRARRRGCRDRPVTSPRRPTGRPSSPTGTRSSRACSLCRRTTAPTQHDELIARLLEFSGAIALRSGMSRDPDAGRRRSGGARRRSACPQR